VLQEDAVFVKRIALQELLRFLLARGLVDDQRAAVIGEWSRDGELAAVAQAGQVLPMHRPDFGNLGFVLQILDDGREFHDYTSFFPFPLSFSLPPCGGGSGWGGHALAATYPPP